MNMMCFLLIRNCRLYNDPPDAPTANIVIDGGLIRSIEKPSDNVTSECVIDAGGKMVIPGLIDIHIQGAGGCDVLDDTIEAHAIMSKTLARLGTTAYLGTTVARPDTGNDHLRIAAHLAGSDLEGATLLGVHLEGPFINPERRGGIAPEAVLPPSMDALDDILDLLDGSLSMMTIVPELNGTAEIIRRLVDNGVVASIGHTAASYEETLRSFDTGVSHVTHIFNAMPGLHHRLPGPIPAIVGTPRVTVQLIGDGVHVHPVVVRLLFGLLSPGRIASITDGVQAMGLPEGNYLYNGREYESRDGAARYPDGTLIGSARSLLDIVSLISEFTGCPFVKALETATTVPATVLGINDRKGAIRPGMDADIVILENDRTVHSTIVGGKIRYQHLQS